MSDTDKTVILTEEQQNLIADNLKLVYKFCANKGIHDEDVIQNLIMRLCVAVPSFDKSRGEFSTFVFTVLHNEWIKQIILTEKESLPDIWEEYRLDAHAYKDEDLEVCELVGFEDSEFLKIENADNFKRALQEYKYKYPFSWERDIKICYSLANNSIPVDEYKKVYGISEQRARQILIQVSKFFTDFASGNIKPLKIRKDIDNDLFIAKDEYFSVSNDNFPVLLGWVNNRIEISDRVTKLTITSRDLATLASEELGIDVGNPDIKKALYLLDFYPNSEDLDFKSDWEYYINKGSNLFKSLRRNKK